MGFGRESTTHNQHWPDHETREKEKGKGGEMKQEMKCPIDLSFVSVILRKGKQHLGSDLFRV